MRARRGRRRHLQSVLDGALAPAQGGAASACGTSSPRRRRALRAASPGNPAAPARPRWSAAGRDGLLPGLKLGLSGSGWRRIARPSSRKTARCRRNVLLPVATAPKIRKLIQEISQLERPGRGHGPGRADHLVDTLSGTAARHEGRAARHVRVAVLVPPVRRARAPARPRPLGEAFWTPYDFSSRSSRAGMWPGLVEDVEISIEVGFPDAHGAYPDAGVPGRPQGPGGDRGDPGLTEIRRGLAPAAEPRNVRAGRAGLRQGRPGAGARARAGDACWAGPPHGRA